MMTLHTCACVVLLLAVGICSLPVQVDEESDAVEDTDLAVTCSWEFSYRIRGSAQFRKNAIDSVLKKFFNRLCDLRK